MFKRDDRVCRETDGAGGRRGAPPPGRGRGRGRGPWAGRGGVFPSAALPPAGPLWVRYRASGLRSCPLRTPNRVLRVGSRSVGRPGKGLALCPTLVCREEAEREVQSRLLLPAARLNVVPCGSLA